MNQEQNQAQEVSNLKQQLARYEAMNSYQDDEIDLKELWNVIWAGKWKIILITFVFAVASVLYALSLPNIYKSEALLMPNSQEQKSGGIAGQLGGLASLAGINVSGGSVDKTAYALEVIKSRKFLYKFIEDNNLKVPLMAAIGWKPKENELLIDKEVYDEKTQTWLREVKFPRKAEPTVFETYDKFVRENLIINQDKETNAVKIAVIHYSPYIAKNIVVLLVKAINENIKNQDLEEATKSINYLSKELSDTKVAGMQSMFYELIEQQQQTLMLTKVREDYVLKILDPPIVAEKKDGPKRSIIVILYVFFGGVISILFVLLLSLKSRKGE